MSRKRTKKKKLQVPQTLVDILIPVHGRFDLLKRCLESIPEAIDDIPYQVYIFDNGSPKEEADEFYKNLDKSVKVTRSKDNLGFPESCNRLVNSGKSPLLFLLNSDVILHKNSMDLLVRAMDDPKIGVAGMRLIFPDDAETLTQDTKVRPAGKLQHIGLTTNIRAEVIHAFIGWGAEHPKVMAQKEVFAVTGAALMTRRDIWRKIKGFRVEYGVGTYEEVDFQMSVREMGYNIVVVPEASGLHYTGATAEQYGIRYNLQGNQMAFLQRWGNKLDWWQWRQA
jgi:GT2 family glycosyltransferase